MERKRLWEMELPELEAEKTTYETMLIEECDAERRHALLDHIMATEFNIEERIIESQYGDHPAL